MWFLIAIVIVGVFFLVRYLVDKIGSREVTEQVTVAGMERAGEACYVTYRTAAGKQRRCRVPEGEYQRTREGETGKLTYKRDVFVEFEGDDPFRMHR